MPRVCARSAYVQRVMPTQEKIRPTPVDQEPRMSTTPTRSKAWKEAGRSQTLFSAPIHAYQRQHVAISSGSDDVVFTCADGYIRVWEGFPDEETRCSPTCEQLRFFARTSDTLSNLAFSPDGRLLVGLSVHHIHVWQWPHGTLMRRQKLGGLMPSS